MWEGYGCGLVGVIVTLAAVEQSVAVGLYVTTDGPVASRAGVAAIDCRTGPSAKLLRLAFQVKRQDWTESKGKIERRSAG